MTREGGGSLPGSDLTTSEYELARALAVLPGDTVAALRAELPRRWRARAACRDADPELWFPVREVEKRAALRLCGGCPVRRPCLAVALLLGEPYGVWGGQSPRARAALRRALERGAPAADVLDAAEHGEQSVGRAS